MNKSRDTLFDFAIKGNNSETDTPQHRDSLSGY